MGQYQGVRINNEWRSFATPDIGKIVILPGAGNVIASAIKRTSKNAYSVIVITTTDADCLFYTSISAVVNYLNALYRHNVNK